MFVTSSENVAWLLNVRGKDSEFSPIPNCYLVIDKKMKVFLFCDLKKIDEKFKKKLSFLNIISLDHLENFLIKIKKQNFLIDDLTCSIFYKHLIEKHNKIFYLELDLEKNTMSLLSICEALQVFFQDAYRLISGLGRVAIHFLVVFF